MTWQIEVSRHETVVDKGTVLLKSVLKPSSKG